MVKKGIVVICHLLGVCIFTFGSQYEFSKPSFDSGWRSISQGQTLTVTHNVGGNADDYVVDLIFRDTDGWAKVNQRSFGGDYNAYGAYWHSKTPSTIKVFRASGDSKCDQFRLRIWEQPVSNYDSGWISLFVGGTKNLIHNIGGNSDDYVVYMEFLDYESYGFNQIFYGGMTAPGGSVYGAYWFNLDSDGISIKRQNNDYIVDDVRIRIWKVPNPDYDSGWTSLNLAEFKTFTHNLGGPWTDYVVDMQFKQDGASSPLGKHQRYYGGRIVNGTDYWGADWITLDASKIVVIREAEAADVDQVRVRLWRAHEPLYDSDWNTIAQYTRETWNHNLGGDPDDYVVKMEFKDGSQKINNKYYGTVTTIQSSASFYGAAWHSLTSNSIDVVRAANDSAAEQVRVRIWIPPQADFDSGWTDIHADETIAFEHNLGGVEEEYVVYLEAKAENGTRHHSGYGVDIFHDYDPDMWYGNGFHWKNLTNSSISVYRGISDNKAPQVRVRIWKNIQYSPDWYRRFDHPFGPGTYRHGHTVGGDADDYVLEMEFEPDWQTNRNHMYFGGSPHFYTRWYHYGVYLEELTASSIFYNLGTDDNYADYVSCWIWNTKYTPKQVFVSGAVMIGSYPLSGVTLTFSGAGGGTCQTDADGKYAMSLPYGYTGTVTPSKTGFTFKPLNSSFSNLTSNATASFAANGPFIAITSPTAGVNWDTEENHLITWDSFGSLGEVEIVLLFSGVPQHTIAPSTPDDGSYVWYPPASLETRSDYFIHIFDDSDPSVHDYGSYFTLTQASITDIEPGGGGGGYQINSNQTITWQSTGSIETVDIELNTGSGWTAIATNTANDGSYSWVVPASPSDQCMIRVKDHDDGNPSDTSSQFTILTPINIETSPPGLTIVVDGESYTAPQTFHWTEYTTHTLDVPSTQGVTGDSQHVFDHWNDEAPQSRTIETPGEATTYTAFYTVQYSLNTFVPLGGGTVSPSGTNWFDSGSEVSLTASPSEGYVFSNWMNDASGSENPLTVVMDSAKSIAAKFSELKNVTITTSPPGLEISADSETFTSPHSFQWAVGTEHTIGVTSPQDGTDGTRYVYGSWSDGGAQSHTINAPVDSSTFTASFNTQFQLTTAASPSGGGIVSPVGSTWYNSGATAVPTATANSGYTFLNWSGDASGSENPASVLMDGPKAVVANFNSVITKYNLTISAGSGGTTSPVPGIYPHDNGDSVEVTAVPDTASGYVFSGWTGDVPSGQENSNPVTVSMSSDKALTATFSSQPPDAPEITLSRNTMAYGAVISGASTSPQEFIIANSGGGTLMWAVSDDAAWMACQPTSGSGDAKITVSVDPSGLRVGTYAGKVTVSSSNASNSPQKVDVTLKVYAADNDQEPFGVFDTPADGATVSGNIPVTGWALDDVEVSKVEIKRNSHPDDPAGAVGPDGLVYIGKAYFVKGARPDVEAAYPGYPWSDRAGWGCMVLTNFLPNQGNGDFTLYAFAYDASGQKKELGQKTITCDNANRIKPFGTIDTPKLGEEVSGAAYVNFAWALTPQPKEIPKDGSTLWVYVDGVPLGHPTYNQYRQDIATLFPGYANSEGAVGIYLIDTTAYENGMHMLSWSMTDDEGAVDGMSRYFVVSNLGGATTAVSGGGSKAPSMDRKGKLSIGLDEIRYGYGEGRGGRRVPGVESRSQGPLVLEVEQLERLEIRFKGDNGHIFLGWGSDVASELPVGSTLDQKQGIFAWIPGPGFLGKHVLHFAVSDGIHRSRSFQVIINIIPKSHKFSPDERVIKNNGE